MSAYRRRSIQISMSALLVVLTSFYSEPASAQDCPPEVRKVLEGVAKDFADPNKIADVNKPEMRRKWLEESIPSLMENEPGCARYLPTLPPIRPVPGECPDQVFMAFKTHFQCQSDPGACGWLPRDNGKWVASIVTVHGLEQRYPACSAIFCGQYPTLCRGQQAPEPDYSKQQLCDKLRKFKNEAPSDAQIISGWEERMHEAGCRIY